MLKRHFYNRLSSSKLIGLTVLQIHLHMKSIFKKKVKKKFVRETIGMVCISCLCFYVMFGIGLFCLLLLSQHLLQKKWSPIILPFSFQIIMKVVSIFNFLQSDSLTLKKHVFCNDSGTYPQKSYYFISYDVKIKRKYFLGLLRYFNESYFLADIKCQHCGNILSLKNESDILLHTKLCQYVARPDSNYKHVCHSCLYHTNHIADMKSHLRKHSGERPYKCLFCKYCCTQSGALHRHIRIRHSEEHK